MRKNIRRILRVLDGTPQGYGEKPTVGQSMVELALVMPLLFILLVGLIEVGWFSRNYLTLLEVTRVGARRGATLQEEYSPLQWERYEQELGYSLALAGIPDVDPNFCSIGSNCITSPAERQQLINARNAVRDCRYIGTNNTYVGFYNLILCQMLDSIRPLSIRTNDIDDIIISVFSVMMIDNRPIEEGGHINLQVGTPVRDNEFDRQGFIPVVVGRWPTQANECNVWQGADGTLYRYQGGSDFSRIFERDPFDYYRQVEGNSPYDVSMATIVRQMPDGSTVHVPYPIELAEETPDGWRSTGFDSYTKPELQRGFSYLGQHQNRTIQRNIDGAPAFLRCWGSERDSYWLQDVLYQSDFVLNQDELTFIRENGIPDYCIVNGHDCDQREFIPNLGIVLVELYWQHHLLLELPIFSPFYNMLNSNQTTIYVWSAFPAPSVVPRVNYARASNETLIQH
jgi:hypothetical protein